MQPFLLVSAHKYVALSDLKDRRAGLLPQCREWNLKGDIVLSPEGIYVSVGGEAEAVARLIDALRCWPELSGLQPRTNGTERVPFVRMHVRVKREIASLGVPVDPVRHPVDKISPIELRQLLDRGKPITLLDVRNIEECDVGSFVGATNPCIQHFHELPDRLRTIPLDSQQTIVAVCSTGLRSEKAAAFLSAAGFANVRLLDGGILNYFEHCGSAHYQGQCFLFEQQAGVGAATGPARWMQCGHCRHPLTIEDQHHEYFVAGESCRYCRPIPAIEMTKRIATRREQIDSLIYPLPGSVPHDQFRRITIPADCDGLTLMDALCRIVSHVPERFWRERFDSGLLLDAAGQPAIPSQRVRAGEQYRHRFPAVVEPDVNMRIEVLHEDDALVVLNKPAPLPMHAGGRFHRNTLKHLLDALYSPQQPRPAHRLDANTTGALVVARTSYFAGKIQPQFARGEVEKTYLVRVQGHPRNDAIICTAPISSDAGHAGSRIVDLENGQHARTDFRVLQRLSDGTSLVEAQPRTGRTNQIRVHLWHLGTPVCGDPVYLRDDELGDSQTLPVDAPPLCLHAWRIRFRHPLSKAMCEFTAPPPAWFAPATDDQRCPPVAATWSPST